MTPDEEYWNHCARGELRLQRCDDCGAWLSPPATSCRECLSTRLTWTAASGRATVWSWIRMHRKYFAAPEFAPPYVVGMVLLEEGVRLISSIATPEGIRDPAVEPAVDAPLTLYFDEEPDAEGRRLPRFRLTEA
ncbi:Zn-ribbon domain-containing OB-fold protein [Microbacterium ulmi]|uniref:DUF35 domain-containing protein n=1 Tax=Microbacterium ulmi TaxID=179095 RepID=A0A7Y2Q0R8_9MICO|nr:OB-fold domain-containing protein [Microbacterium ulmi]NII69858.1 hypothetical protein [Microbacterium ulmi]NNH03175.1 hypothetical protein [Microbacterium ulmi]